MPRLSSARSLCVALVVLAACSADSQEDSSAETADEADLVAAARPVPPAAAQALALRERIIAGLRPEGARKLHMKQLVAQDFRGKNAFFLNFTAPVAIDDPWAFAAKLDPEQWLDETNDSAWTTTLIGATTVHAPVTLSAVGLGLLVKLGRTAEAMGGGGKVQAILAATPSRFFLQSTSGQLWDVDTSALAEQATLDELKVDYQQTVKSLSKQSMVKDMRQKWAPALADTASGARPSSRKMADFVDDDGQLDLQRAVDQLEKDSAFAALAPQLDAEESFSPDAFSPDGPGQTPLAQKQTQTCKKVLWWEECTTIQEGAFSNPAKQQAHRAIQRKKYTVPDCVPGRDPVANTYQGCAPAAVVSLLWREWARGAKFSGVGAFDNGAYDASSYSSKNNFDSFLSQGLADEMGSCRIGDSGTMTLPWNVVSGANSWLKQHGSSLRLKSVSSTLLDNSLLSGAKAAVLRDRVGKEKGPVAALVQLGKTSYHYTPVAKYRIVTPPAGPIEVYVVGFDEGQSTKSWYALHDPWTVATGLYWVE